MARNRTTSGDWEDEGCEKKPGRIGTIPEAERICGRSGCRMRRGENWTWSTSPGRRRAEAEEADEARQEDEARQDQTRQDNNQATRQEEDQTKQDLPIDFALRCLHSTRQKSPPRSSDRVVIRNKTQNDSGSNSAGKERGEISQKHEERRPNGFDRCSGWDEWEWGISLVEVGAGVGCRVEVAV